MSHDVRHLGQRIATAIGAAPDGHAAMERAVSTLKAELPHYSWVGIYLLEGDELVRYLGCSLETESEIVVPIMHGDAVLGEIDIDSDKHAAFTAADRALLEDGAWRLPYRRHVSAP